MARSGTVQVFTDRLASPTGFPFKVVQIEGTNSDADLYRRRERKCDLGYLRTAYRREDGRIGYRCAAEPGDAYVTKGGKAEETEGRKCLCNALMADAGHPQARADGPERPLVTSGDDLRQVADIASQHADYAAADVIHYLLGGSETTTAPLHSAWSGQR
jgi:NAD(P)H-dependent flavin oxidoreductase YrpB (nitropropane dioxygenase family)